MIRLNLFLCFRLSVLAQSELGNYVGT